MRVSAMLCSALLLSTAACTAQDHRSVAEFYVASDGSDSGPGDRAKPFATLESARDAVRALKKSGAPPTGGVTVWIRGGIYPRTGSFVLTTEDSGTKDSPIIYRAYAGEEARLVGGREVKGFKPVKDAAALERIDPAARGKVMQADLKAQGITDFGKLSVRGFGKPSQRNGLLVFLCQLGILLDVDGSLGDDQRRPDGVDVHVIRSPFQSQRLGDHLHGPLGGRVAYVPAVLAADAAH